MASVEDIKKQKKQSIYKLSDNFFVQFLFVVDCILLCERYTNENDDRKKKI